MSDHIQVVEPRSISPKSARQLATTDKTKPQLPSKTPRWLLKAIPWVNVDTGIYRVNRVKCHLGASFLESDIEYEKKSHSNPTVAEEILNHYLFKQLSPDDRAAIAKEMVQQDTKPNEVIIKEGEHDSKFYVILSGNYEVSYKSKFGKSQVMNNLSKGDHFGELALLGNFPGNATVTSKSTGTLCRLSKTSFEKIIKNPIIKNLIEQSAEERMRELKNMTMFGEKKIPIKSGHVGEPKLPTTYIEYEENPLEHHLSVIQTIVGIHTRIADLYNTPYNQVEEQIRLTTEMILEREEFELINNKSFGLLHKAMSKGIITTRNGPPTPDDLDDLLALVWKKPTFFFAHPKAIAAFGRECTKRGVPPPTTNMFGGTFITWRGIPMIPTDKLEIENDPNNPSFGTTNIICIRVGEQDQGVVGLYKNDVPGQTLPGLAIHFMGIDEHSIANYLITKYFSLAILVPDAVAVLRDVEVGHYHD